MLDLFFDNLFDSAFCLNSSGSEFNLIILANFAFLHQVLDVAAKRDLLGALIILASEQERIINFLFSFRKRGMSGGPAHFKAFIPSSGNLGGIGTSAAHEA